ncbi:cation transporter [Leucobacter sp. CSA1]|uniref:Cation transporter n=1 Tax=Leucobacter chromiisoli TaxID=2796471 RepID=A0A934UV84_9MICO|nr:cation transporter [Leucobacter chromiisoli]MBK0419645.1 cation transporter [Leucobacter chromiisoli]
MSITDGIEVHDALPEKQALALKKATRWQIFTICYTAVTITVVAFVLGNSQAMKTAWVEDMLSLLPQIAFLVALIFIHRKPTPKHPYGQHRAMSVGHLVGGVALLAVGTTLAAESVVGLIRAEHPSIGTVNLFGHTIWLGWLMIAVMAVIVVGPVFMYGPAKAKLAPILHNKLLYADADMAKADWQTNAASIVGVLGVGLGWWWLDGAAAVFISLGIIWDGIRNTKAAVSDQMDQRARTFDDKKRHPLADGIHEYLAGLDWVEESGIRMRDQGQVFHVEVFVTPRDGVLTVEQADAIVEGLHELDWKIQDVIVGAASALPDHLDRPA